MPDAHDERGGDETPLARVQAFQRAANPNGDYHWPAEEAANVNGVPLYFDDIESLSAADNFDAVDAVVACWRKAEERLSAATARAEKAEALVAGFGPACCVCGRILGYRNYRDQLFCWPCADGKPKTTDASPDGRSEPVERSETPGGAFHENTSSILPQGLSEPEPPRDTSAWCWAPNPHGPLCCERLRDHEPPHRRGERTWTDDTTEDGQHG